MFGKNKLISIDILRENIENENMCTVCRMHCAQVRTRSKFCPYGTQISGKRIARDENETSNARIVTL